MDVQNIDGVNWTLVLVGLVDFGGLVGLWWI